MKKTITLLAVLLLWGFSVFAAPPGDQSQWTLTFSDEFDGTVLDTTKWATTYPGGARTNNDELEWYVDEPDHHVVSNGTLKLIARKESAGGRSYASGMITSYPSFNQAYGYWEGRMKLPKGQGLWPALWTLPYPQAWPPEIDIMENLGHQPNVIYMTYHWGTSSSHQQSGSSYSGPDYSADFHTFGVEWTSSAITWYVDGVQRNRVTSSITTGKMYVLVNLAVGGSWPGSPNSSTVFPAQLEVDWIRVYQRGSSPPPSEPPAPPQNLRAPTVSIIYPTNGASFSRYSSNVTVRTVASDDIVVKKIQFYVNNILYSTISCNAQSYNASFRWPVWYLRGAYALQTKAIDGDGKVGSSQTVNVTIR